MMFPITECSLAWCNLELYTVLGTTTSTARPLVFITRSGDNITGIFNTTAGASTGGWGYYSNSEPPSSAIDNSTSTKYLNYGFRGLGTAANDSLDQPGAGTGFYVTSTISNASVAVALLFATANDFPNRDPTSVTIEGSNATGAALDNGLRWTLIYTGSTGINALVDAGRYTFGVRTMFPNTMAFASYRFLVTAQRGNGSCVQYSEAHVLGYIW